MQGGNRGIDPFRMGLRSIAEKPLYRGMNRVLLRKEFIMFQVSRQKEF